MHFPPSQGGWLRQRATSPSNSDSEQDQYAAVRMKPYSLSTAPAGFPSHPPRRLQAKAAVHVAGCNRFLQGNSVDEGVFIQNVANALKDKLAFSVYLGGSSLEQTITYAVPESPVRSVSEFAIRSKSHTRNTHEG